MNIKKMSIVFLSLLFLILCITAVSASDEINSTDIVIDEGNDVQNDVSPSSSENQTAAKIDTQPKQTKTQTKKIATDVDAEDVAVVYKKNNYFKIKVEDKKTDKDLKNVKVNVKIFTKSKSKTYTLKTNSKGVIKFNTKNLKLGNHKVIISSADSRYQISKKANIFVGKKTSTTLKINSKKKISKTDIIRTFIRNDEDDKEVKIAYKGTSKNTKILKAVFYFKNKLTGKVIKKVDNADFDDGRWDLPNEDYEPWKYSPLKILLWYVKC